MNFIKNISIVFLITWILFVVGAKIHDVMTIQGPVPTDLVGEGMLFDIIPSLILSVTFTLLIYLASIFEKDLISNRKIFFFTVILTQAFIIALIGNFIRISVTLSVIFNIFTMYPITIAVIVICVHLFKMISPPNKD